MRNKSILKFFAISSIFAASIPAQAAGAEAAPKLRDPDVAERAYIASTAYHVIKRYFAHAEALPADFDFEARYKEYLREAIAAPDRVSFSRATMRFFASLKNGHSGFYDQTLFGSPPIPFLALPVEGRWTVIRTRTPALAPGDVIETIEGKPIDDWLRPIMAHIGQSNRAAQERLTWSQSFLFPERFTLGLAGGRQVMIDRTKPSTGEIRGFTLPDEVTTTKRPDGVAVIRIPGFDEPKYEAAAIAAIRALPPSTPVLFDLRGNGGGNTPNDLLGAIMTAPYRETQFVTPTTLAMNDAYASANNENPMLPREMARFGPDTTQPKADAWTGRIALLVNGGCASACEDFALRFKTGKRGLVLGEATFGSTGQPYFVRFDEFGMFFRVSTKREYLPDGAQFEGVGVTPDKPVPLKRSGLTTGVDEQLEEAVRILRAQ